MISGSNGAPLGSDLWYQDAVIYQTHVKAFCDSYGDGIGDFRGLTSKLDYLEELGVTAIWLLPFYPSPLKDDGYDIANYTDVHSRYGTIQDFTRFLKEAHRRGLRVITELVINHTSDQHPWFQRARKAPPGSRERDFYVWSDTQDRYRGTRIIFKDFEPSNWSADPVAKAYYWHRFYSHQPDLNFDNPEVHKALYQVLDFWMRRGVDGLRLDAVPYLYEREGTSCENLPETHAYLKKLRRYFDQRYPGRMLLAEANQWPEDAAAYFGDGDECHMNFHFPLMPRLFMAVRMEDRYPIVDIIRQTPAIPGNSQWAIFLRNHDELTLEMVTDRERDYMYQVYARDREMRINLGIRRRLAPLLNNDRRAIELMNALLFSMPGSPIIYYGDEIGMGDNVYLGDRDGVRTPMQWSADRNAGFSRANPQRLYLPVIIDPQFHYETVNVEAQENNPQSLLWWMRRLIGLRKRFQAFSRGSMEFVESSNHKVLAFVRQYADERILVVANLSRFAQQAELELPAFVGSVPLEVFGQTRFRPIGQGPYSLTLSPHAFYWFALEPEKVQAVATDTRPAWSELAVEGSWENAFEGRVRTALQRLLPGYLRACPWFAGRDRKIESLRIASSVRLAQRRQTVFVLLLHVEYTEGMIETYALPLAYASGKAAETRQEESPQTVVAKLRIADRKETGVLYDALCDEQFGGFLLSSIERGRRASSKELDVVSWSSEELDSILAGENGRPQSASILNAQRRRTSIVYANRLILKVFRKIEPGINPDLEVSRFLTRRGFEHVPPTVGALEFHDRRPDAGTWAILHRYVPNEGTAFEHTLDRLDHFYERALATGAEVQQVELPCENLLLCARAETPDLARDLFGFYLPRAHLLGQRTAEMHLALASETEDPAFAPEQFTEFYQRSYVQALRNLRSQTLQSLRGQLRELPDELQESAKQVLDSENDIRDRFLLMRSRRFQSLRIRCHGNLRLAQILNTGKDFAITDFEGDMARPLSERRGKHSALRDVAKMIRSFHHAAHEAMLRAEEGRLPAGRGSLDPWRRYWQAWTPATFLKGYFETAGSAPFVPPDEEEMRVLLELSLLEESLYELSAAMKSRPDWIRIPLEAILQIVRPAEPTLVTVHGPAGDGARTPPVTQPAV